MFTPKGLLISLSSVERQFYLYIHVSLARTTLRSPSPSLPKSPLWSALVNLAFHSYN